MAPSGVATSNNKNNNNNNNNNNNKVVISLLSDDEDNSYLHHKVLPATVPGSSMPPSRALAFNGLPTSAGQQLGANSGNGASKRSARQKAPAIQPSVAHRDENTGVGASGSCALNGMNAGAKRRKLENGAAQPGRISSGPIRPPTITNGHRPEAQSAGPRLSIGSQAIAGKGTIITGAQRAPAISPASSPKVLPDPHLLGMPSAMEPQMKRVLEHQVLPHVHAAVRPYRDTLTHDERTKIGQTAASRLVTVPGFMAHYIQHKKSLTPAFESQVKLNAYLFVNQGVESVVKQRLQAEAPKSATRKDSTIANSRHGLKSSVETSENGSSPPSEGFEQSSLLKNPGRAISVSTSTSYSNDHTDAEAGKQAIDIFRSRRTAAMLPRGTYDLTKNHLRRSAAEMAIVRGMNQGIEGRSGSNIQAAPSSAIRPVKGTPAQQQTVKHIRRRITRLEMAEARRVDARTHAPAITSSRPRQTDFAGANNLQAPVLARGNVARAYVQQPVRHSTGYLPALPYEDPALLPYISSANRKKLKRKLAKPGIVKLLSKQELQMLKSATLHVPFSPEEIMLLRRAVLEQSRVKHLDANPAIQIVKIMTGKAVLIPRILAALQDPQRGQKTKSDLFRTRDAAAITAFLQDASTANMKALSEQLCITFPPDKTADRLIALLRDREVYGMSPERSRRGRSAFKVVASSHLEDSFIRLSEWTDCSGDISSISWTGPDSFICGALAHSDSHNMQYNKPGNLMVGSTSLAVVKSYPDHRVIRPIVVNEGAKENVNALESMRTTQSPWMYESVVSTTHCDLNGFSFTASFDMTVKIWSPSASGSGMTLRGTWPHRQKVNFVAASPYHDRVATACATNGNAVRVYSFDSDAISMSRYDEYCRDRPGEPSDEMGNHAKWTYQPATMQWGKSPGVVDFLLVGYSPRSTSDNDSDVPELKRNTGEICLWNTTKKTEIFITSAKTQNVFEVIWHPTQPIFLAATSPHGPCDSTNTRTQVRIFHQHNTGTFMNVKTLDCPAIDINELTIKANSTVECFVTASCTDGVTYVWDTARGDLPLHALQHGETLDNPDPDIPLDVGDSGIKFAAWGRSADRFYTGGSDGVIRAWNPKAAKGKVFIRTVVSISGGISTGVFNEDCSKLLIGDATGKIHLLGIDDGDVKDDLTPAGFGNIHPRTFGSQLSRTFRRPKLVIPHPEPEPPPGYVVEAVEKSGVEIAQEYLSSSQLVRVSEPYNFVCQGPNYLQTNAFWRGAHIDGDPSQPLLAEHWAVQQWVINSHRILPIHPRIPTPITSSDIVQHQKNLRKNQSNFRFKTLFEWDPSKIDSDLWGLLDNGKLLELAEDIKYDYSYEPTPRFGQGFIEEEEDDDIHRD